MTLFEDNKPNAEMESKIISLIKLEHANVLQCKVAWMNRDKRLMVVITEGHTESIYDKFIKKQVRMKLQVIKRWIRHVLKGLDYLHNQGIILGNLHCGNIFTSSDSSGTIKIGLLAHGFLLRLTHPYACNGIPGYLAPEFSEEKQDEKVDIYALGMCVLQMLTFKFPYHKCTNAYQIFAKQKQGEKPSALSQILDSSCTQFIESCIEKDPVKRPSAAELLAHPFLDSSPNAEVNLSKIVNVDTALSTSYSELPAAAPTTRPFQRTENLHSSAQSMERFSLKCFYPGHVSLTESECVRIYMDQFETIEKLIDYVASTLGMKTEDVLKIKYKDADDDLVTITRRSTLEEIYEFACSVHVYTRTSAEGRKAQPLSLLGSGLILPMGEAHPLRSTTPTNTVRPNTPNQTSQSPGTSIPISQTPVSLPTGSASASANPLNTHVPTSVSTPSTSSSTTNVTTTASQTNDAT
eukprot:TRINITY_DN8062_c0_g1_i1.p1 TRINITY_DN8062_c0_g1~~TRINITY_DN8062_c0_g1_i1.p1  ORF type:complete len:465 (+),score=38.33 TRINITY_DN8062_c0_g1_i1:3-1397(+)